jgi:hypothetical protein
MASSSASTSEFFLIEHPSVVKNLDNAISSLGGKDSIKEVGFELFNTANLKF